jgi:hypothetical protein
MSDLISRSALLAEYDKHHVGAPGRARKLIEDAPTIDAVPVVRCWQCIHSDMIDNTRYCFHWERNMDDDGYCHEGVC